MKTNTKGFTLIELLAVIVILAIIALIATPIVLNLIDKARKGAAESDAYSFISAVETGVATALLEDASINFANATCDATVTANSITCTLANAATKTLTVDIKGEKPTAGTVTLDANGAVSNYTGIIVGGYTVEKSGDKASAHQ